MQCKKAVDLNKKYQWIKKELDNGEWVSFHEGTNYRIIVSMDEVILGNNFLIYDNGEQFALISDIVLESTRLIDGLHPATSKEAEEEPEEETYSLHDFVYRKRHNNK